MLNSHKEKVASNIWHLLFFTLSGGFLALIKKRTKKQLALSQVRICKPHPTTLPSVLIPFLWKMRNVLKRMKNQFSDFYFSIYREFHRKLR